jgi:hypothetical protein
MRFVQLAWKMAGNLRLITDEPEFIFECGAKVGAGAGELC